MDTQKIISRVNSFLHEATVSLVDWLNGLLPNVTNDWWNDCVLSSLSYTQREMAVSRKFSKLSDFDLAALLRIANKSWYDLRTVAYLPTKEREVIRTEARLGTYHNGIISVGGSVCTGDLFEKLGVVYEGGVAVVKLYFTACGMCFRYTAAQPSELLLYFGKIVHIENAYRTRKPAVIGYYILLGTAVEPSDGDQAGVCRVYASCKYALKSDDHIAGGYKGIDSLIGVCAVA